MTGRRPASARIAFSDEIAVPGVGADAGWTQGLQDWTRQQLLAGAEGVHATAKGLFDQAVLEAALAHCNGHRGDAATALGLGRNTVTRKLGSSRKRR